MPVVVKQAVTMGLWEQVRELLVLAEAAGVLAAGKFQVTDAAVAVVAAAVTVKETEIRAVLRQKWETGRTRLQKLCTKDR